ncbi:MAG TPA: peptide chain release factor N(5)-glutamine methyltransferase [Blastocatellia bacterium]|nr:peptide chain release factor N(5)-glutamine methyltransferase [Blastocatellia bacterium]
MPTISQAIIEGSRRLRAAGVDHDRLTAGLLLRHLIGVERTHLLTRSEEQIGADQYRDYLELVERRAAGEPLQYVIGHQEFYELDFIVTPDVLIPRPETEFLIERVMKLAEESERDSLLIVDVGTGSGCIAVTIAKLLPGARLIATDVSPAALTVAQRNAERNRVRDRIEFLEGDLLEPLAERGLQGAVDILASNPPYVNQVGRQLLQREVREWEPHEALFGGADGLDFYRRLLAETAPILKPQGYLVLEIGFSQLEAISEIVSGSGLRLCDVTRDLQGIPRVLCLQRTV